MQVVQVIVAVAAVLSIMFFAMYVIGLLRMPSGHRPATRTLNRFGEEVTPEQNPGYRETEDEAAPP